MGMHMRKHFKAKRWTAGRYTHDPSVETATRIVSEPICHTTSAPTI